MMGELIQLLLVCAVCAVLGAALGVVVRGR